jgi:hypothetical protein
VSPRKLPLAIDRYEVIDRLGHGGMGIVYRALDPRIGRTVAIKLLRISDEGLRDRFLQEARAAGNLTHRNIVTIYDCGEHEGQPFIVMEFVEGVTLAEQIRSNLPLSLSRKLELVEELAGALDYAHNKGVVHRDVKPANIMLDRDGVLKILDFGIARFGDSGLTQVGTMMGTPNYMSPEQIDGRPVDRRSDIFAVGLLFYELLAYRQAFPGETAPVVMHAIMLKAPAPLEELCHGLDPAIVATINRAIEKDPAKRYQTLAAMAGDIAKIRRRVGTRRGWADDESTVAILTPPPHTPPGRRTSRLGTGREALEKRRAERIESYLQTAQSAFSNGDYATALDACEQATMLDADEPRVADLLEQAREALDKQRIGECLDSARECLDRQDLEAASQFVERALELDPAFTDARELQASIDELKRRREQQQKKQQEIQAALVRARANLSSGHLESAIRVASEILVDEPTNAEAHELTHQALVALDDRRRQESWNRAAHAAVAEQKREFAAGRCREAVEALERFVPPHEAVTAALGEMRAELAAMERRAQEEAERRIREEVEAAQRQRAQQRWVARQMELARAAIGEQQFVDALEVLQHVEQVSPATQGLAELLVEANAGKAALEAEAKRQTEITDKLGKALSEHARGRLAEALSLINEVLAQAPAHPDALARRQAIEAAIEAERRQQAWDQRAEAAVLVAQQQFEAGEHAAALAALESFEPKHVLTTRTRDELKAKLREIERLRQDEEQRTRAEIVRGAVERARLALQSNKFDAAVQALDEAEAIEPNNPDCAALRARVEAGREEVLRRGEHERLALEVIGEARSRFASGERAAGIEMLEKFVPPHPLVSQALQELRADVAEIDRQRRETEERRRRAEALKLALARGTAALDASDFESALRIAEEAMGLQGDSAEATALKARAIAGVQEQHRRENHDRRAQEAVAEARRKFAAGSSAEAIALLERFAPEHSVVSDALVQLRGEAAALVIAARKGMRVQHLVKEARADLSRRALTSAQERVDEALSLEPGAPQLLELGRQIEVATVVARAKATASDQAAITMLRQAAELDPGNQECLDLLSNRQAALSSEVERLLDDGQFDRAEHALDSIERLGIVTPAILALRERAKAVQVADARPLFVEADSMASGMAASIVAAEEVLPRSHSASDAAAIPRARRIESLKWILTVGSVLALIVVMIIAIRSRQVPRKEGDVASNPSQGATIITTIVPARPVTTVPPQPSVPPTVVRSIPPTVAPTVPRTVPPTVPQGQSRTAPPSVLPSPTSVPPDPSLVASVPSVPIIPPTPTSIPVALPPTSLASTTSVPVVTPAPPQLPDPQIVTRLLAQFSAAYRSFDLNAIQRVYPGFNEIKTFESEKKTYSWCTHQYSPNYNISPVGNGLALVIVDSVKSCKPTTAQPARSEQWRESFTIKQEAGGSWIVTDRLRGPR